MPGIEALQNLICLTHTIYLWLGSATHPPAPTIEVVSLVKQTFTLLFHRAGGGNGLETPLPKFLQRTQNRRWCLQTLRPPDEKAELRSGSRDYEVVIIEWLLAALYNYYDIAEPLKHTSC